MNKLKSNKLDWTLIATKIVKNKTNIGHEAKTIVQIWDVKEPNKKELRPVIMIKRLVLVPEKESGHYAITGHNYIKSFKDMILCEKGLTFKMSTFGEIMDFIVENLPIEIQPW